MLLPLGWMIWAALQGSDGSLSLQNVVELTRRRPFGTWIVNSLFVASAQTTLLVLTSAMGGFALAKYQFRGRRLVIGMLLATLFLPFQVLLPSAYDLMIRLGWVNSFAAVVIPGAVSAFGTFLFMQACRQVPDELIAAARIDGCSELRVWWEVALPLLRPMSGAYTLMAFVTAWNSYLWPATVLLDESRYTLAIGLASMIGLPEYESQFGLLMAGTLLGLLPLIALFFWLRREFVAGLAGGAIKG